MRHVPERSHAVASQTHRGARYAVPEACLACSRGGEIEYVVEKSREIAPSKYADWHPPVSLSRSRVPPFSARFRPCAAQLEQH